MLYDDGFSVIDAFIVKSGPGRFTMVMKDERALPTPTKHLRVAEATRADGPYRPASAPISVDWVEGPSVLKRAGGWIVYYDEYTRQEVRRAAVGRPENVAAGGGAVFPRGVRHGTAFEVPADIAGRLAAK